MEKKPLGYSNTLLKMSSNNMETFKLAFEHAPIGMFVANFKGRFTEVNNAMSDIVLYPVNKLLTMGFQDIVHPDDINKDLALVRELFEGTKPKFILEKRFVTGKGDVIHALLHGALMRDHKQRPRYFIGQIIDVTERKGFEKAMLHLAYHDQLTGFAQPYFVPGKVFFGFDSSQNRQRDVGRRIYPILTALRQLTTLLAI